jgi:endonuclease G
MSPSEDFSSCVICVDESFYLTNIVPQNYKNNQVIWRYLEAKVRKYAQQKNPVYVITGPVYLRYPYTIIGRGIAVPEGLFKVIIDTVTGQSIAFYMDNQEVPISDLAGKVIPLNMLEAVVGLGFDESLDKTTSGSYQEWFSYLK